MTAYLDIIRLNYPNTYEARQRLNEEFYDQSKIPNAVSIIYYPVQHGPMSHAEFEVEGTCYYFRSGIGPCRIPDSKSYHKRVYKIRRDTGFQPELAFVRIGINVSPKQIKKIHEEIDGIKTMLGLTCMHGVNRVIKRYTDYSVPFPVSLFPTMSAGYLLASKKLSSSHKISKIDPHIVVLPVNQAKTKRVFAAPESGIIRALKLRSMLPFGSLSLGIDCNLIPPLMPSIRGARIKRLQIYNNFFPHHLAIDILTKNANNPRCIFQPS